MEEVGLIVEFAEQNVRGSTKRECIVKAVDMGDKGMLMMEWRFASWDELKERHPDFKSLLKMMFLSYNWRAVDCDLMMYGQTVIGYEGLYEDIESRVMWDGALT